MIGLWDTREAAHRMGLEYRTALRRLHELHEQHGRLLFRADGGPNTKLRVDADRLVEIDPTVARRVGDAGAELEARVAALEDFQRRALRWFRDVQQRRALEADERRLVGAQRNSP